MILLSSTCTGRGHYRKRLSGGIRLVAVLCALVVVTLVGGCSSKIADEDRMLGSTRLDDVEVRARATILGRHYSASLNCVGPVCQTVAAHDRLLIGYDLRLYRDGHFGVRIAGDIDWTLKHDDREQARAVYERLVLDWCQATDRLAFRVYDPQARMAEPWRLLIPLQADAVVGLVPVDTNECTEALNWTASAEAWLRDQATGDMVCRTLFEQDRQEDGIRCLLREHGAWSRGMARRDAVDREGTAAFEEAVLAVLAVDSTANRSRFAPYRVTSLLAGIDDRTRIARLAREIAADCGASCMPWQLALAATVAADEGDSDWCAQLVRQIDSELDTPGSGHAANAAAVLESVGACAPLNVLAPRMQKALDRPPETTPDRWINPCGGITRQPDTWCSPGLLADARERMRNCPPEQATGGYYSCQALPRIAGTWLSTSCEKKGLARTRELLAEGVKVEVPWEDAVTDGALTALAGCDPQAFSTLTERLPGRDRVHARYLRQAQYGR